MQRSTVLTLLLVVVVATAALVTVYSRGEGAPAPDDGGGRPTEANPAPDRNGGDDTLLAPPGRPTVHVAVRTEATFVPPAAALALTARVDGSGVMLPARVLAGEGAGPAAPPVRSGTALVAVAIETGGEVVRQIEVPGPVPIDYRLGARVVVRGRVAGERWPVRGARVWFGELLADGAQRTATTDAEGTFELDTPAGAGVPLVVTADGMAVHARLLTVAAGGPDVEVRLAPGTRLDVQLAVAQSDDLATARVFVVPTDQVSTAVAQYPFFLQAITDGFAVDANGRAAVPDLPTDGTLGVLVRHARLPGMAPSPVTLRTTPLRHVVPVRFAAATRSVCVVDGDGAPRADVSVWMRRPGQALALQPSLRLLPAALPVRGACLAWTDAAGRCELGALADDGALLSLRAPHCAGLDLPLAALDAAAAIVLPPWVGGEPSFRLQPPARGVVWQASTDLGGGTRATVPADRPWVVSFPHPGRFAVVVTTSVDGSERGRASFTLDVTGPVELQAPRLP